jgi:hypothetical protein
LTCRFDVLVGGLSIGHHEEVDRGVREKHVSLKINCPD